MPLEVLYEDADIIAFNKPAGVHSTRHPQRQNQNMVDLALELRPELEKVTTDTRPSEAGLLHRLDLDTSGVLVFAKTQAAYEKWKTLWTSTEIRKIYMAICTSSHSNGATGKNWAGRRIDFPTYQLESRSKKVRVLTEPPHPRSVTARKLKGQRLQDAHTEILVVFERPDPKNLLEFKVRITTGVRHQIRAHLAAIGFPILGDTLYGGVPSTRIWLHSAQFQEIKAPLPPGWSEANILPDERGAP